MNVDVHNPLSAEVELKSWSSSSASSITDENFGTTPSKEKVDIDVRDLAYSIVLDDKYKTVLENINFHVPHSSICAIMGPSGGGKSTLLDILADRKRSGILIGSVLINQRPRSPLFSRESAYVLQDDVHIAELTVAETIMYSVWTRMPEGTSTEDIQERVRVLLELLGLIYIKDSRVGSALVKGISGGQKKRLSIAESLAALPSLVFLDEPTSGLDSSMALDVMQAVKRLALQGRTCMCSIHQPSPLLFALFDYVLLMEAGRLVFFGAPVDVLEYFTSELGYLARADCSVAEFLVDICNHEGERDEGDEPKSAAELAERYSCSTLAKAHQPRAQAGETITVGLFERRHATRKLTQLRMLIHRSYTVQTRNVPYVLGTLKRSLIIGVIGGVFFEGQGLLSLPLFSSSGVPTGQQLSMSAMLFFLLVYVIDSNDHAIPLVCAQMLQFRREMAAFAYCPSAYWVCAVLQYVPLLFVSHTILITILYLAVQLPLSFSYYCYFHFAYFLATMMSFYISVAVAAWTGSTAISYAIVTNIILFVQFFAGFTVQLSSLPVAWSWVPVVNFARYAYQGVVMNEYEYYVSADDDFDGQSVLEELGFDAPSKMTCMLYVALNIAVLCLIMYFGLRSHLPATCERQNALPVHNSSAVTELDKTLAMLVTAAKWPAKCMISCYGACVELYSRLTAADTLEWPERARARTRKRVVLSARTLRDSKLAWVTDLRCELEFKGVCFSLPRPPSTEATPSGGGAASDNVRCLGEGGPASVVLLNNVSGFVRPGELCALMGPSGAGKTTLLDVLAGRKSTGRVKGSIRFSGRRMARSLAYVMQENAHIPTLTVKESLVFAACLRIGGITAQMMSEQVAIVMDMLALTHIADSVVGDEHVRGISGGELRRLSIGVEIIHLPDLIFLDEPTTGLDSWHALDTMTAVHNLSHEMLTVMCTIHQPSAAVFALFHSLLLLSAGNVVYFGPAKDASAFFAEEVGVALVNLATNPADFVLDVAAGRLCLKTGATVGVEGLARHYVRSKQYSALQSDLETRVKSWVDREGGANADAGTITMLSERPYHTSTWVQTTTLCRRAWLRTIRDPAAVISYFVRHLIIAIFYGSLYFGLASGTEVAVYTNRLALLFYALMFVMFSNIQHTTVVFENRLCFYRERAANAYGALPYFISTFVVSIPASFVNVLVFSAVLYNMAGLYPSAGRFWFFFAVLFACSLTGLFLCHLVANNSSSISSTLAVLPIFIFLNVMLSGYIVLLPDLPLWISTWAPLLSFMRWSFQALVLNEFVGNPSLPYGEFYLTDLDFLSPDKDTCLGILCFFTVTFMVTTILTLKYINYDKR